MSKIYLLELAQGKYYVGSSNQVDKRLLQHFSNNGSSWTKLYPPVQVLAIYENLNAFDEDHYTLQAMRIYGIDNVRGGTFSSVVLPASEETTVRKMLMSANNECFRCGSVEHFADKCIESMPMKEDDACPTCDGQGIIYASEDVWMSCYDCNNDDEPTFYHY